MAKRKSKRAKHKRTEEDLQEEKNKKDRKKKLMGWPEELVLVQRLVVNLDNKINRATTFYIEVSNRVEALIEVLIKKDLITHDELVKQEQAIKDISIEVANQMREENNGEKDKKDASKKGSGSKKASGKK